MSSIDQRYEGIKPEDTGLRYGIIEVTTKCQLRCPGCYMVRRDCLDQGEMTLAEAVHVLDLCRDFCGRELETMDILGGEPLLWPFLKEYIEILIKRGILPWVFTNMLAITPKLAKWLRERDVHVTGKLNVNPNDPSQHRLQAIVTGGTPKTARRLFRSIEIFLEAGYRDPLFRLENLIRRKSLQAVPGYYRWCLDHGVGMDLELLANAGTIGPEYWAMAPTPEEIAGLIRQLQEIRQEYGLTSSKVLLPHLFGACVFKKNGLYFTAQGEIRACSNSDEILARIDGDPDPIQKAWNSRLLCNRRCLTQAKVGEPCHSCDRWEQCQGGCRATVEGMGDPFGGYSLCPLPYL